jgi:addiction module RelE/StbE family toxin
MKIIWSPLAASRLESVFDYINEENETAAYKMVNRILKKVESLSKYSKRGRMVPEASREEIREVFVGEYRIIYRIEAKSLIILTIRNFKQQLLDKDLK